jgi:acyl-CoA thioester hydrolase
MADVPFRFSITFDIRWRDLDALGHVNNAVYFTYLEEARVRYLRELEMVSDNPVEVGIILAGSSCQFKSPLELGEQVTVRLRVRELRNSSFVIEYRIEGDGGRLAATADSVQVCYDYEERHPVPIPDVWREIITAYEPGL